MTRPRAVFLDRDGTLNRDVGYAHRVEELDLIENVVAGLVRIQALGFELFITTNQSGIARGYFSQAAMHAFNQAMLQQLSDAGIVIRAVYFCPFHPTEGVGSYRRDSPLRKPRPGMIAQAAAEHDLDLAASFVIGDKKSDVVAGRAAGCRTILLKTGAAGGGEPDLVAEPDFVAADLLDAARYLERIDCDRTPLPTVVAGCAQ